jgi:hypothetical protein
MDAFNKLDLESLTPIQALNKLYEWKQALFPQE